MTVQEIIKETLNWCNDRRKEKGLEPLDDLPKGERYKGVSCPCGKACGLYVGYNSYFNSIDMVGQDELLSDKSKALGSVPAFVGEFARKFDSGGFPQYEEKK